MQSVYRLFGMAEETALLVLLAACGPASEDAPAPMVAQPPNGNWPVAVRFDPADGIRRVGEVLAARPRERIHAEQMNDPAFWQAFKPTLLEHLATLPGGAWIDYWNPEAPPLEGPTIVTVEAPLHKTPLFLRAGSDEPVLDLTALYKEALAIARTPPTVPDGHQLIPPP